MVKIFPRLENLLDIIHEDAGLLVINKPAGLVCHPTKGDEFSSLISRARLYLKTENLKLETSPTRPSANIFSTREFIDEYISALGLMRP